MRIGSRCPRRSDVHLVMDKLPPTTRPAYRNAGTEEPRPCTCHLTQPSSSLAQSGRTLQKKKICPPPLHHRAKDNARSIYRSVADYRTEITCFSFPPNHNAHPIPFRWTKSADDIPPQSNLSALTICLPSPKNATNFWFRTLIASYPRAEKLKS